MAVIESIIPFLLFLDISGGEILLILIVVFIVFGPHKIPEIARKLGKGIHEIRKASNQIRDEISREANEIKESVNIDVDQDIRQKKSPGEQDQAKRTEKVPDPGDHKPDESQNEPPGSRKKSNEEDGPMR